MAKSATEIVERIRSLRYVHVPVASQLFEEACEEIERLQWQLAGLRLTDAERSAVADAADAADRYAESVPEAAKTAATLRSLLDRLA
jgi:hypothetical protein